MRMMGNVNRMDGLWGLMVGDALGVPAEFKSRSQLKINPITDMVGFGTHNQEAGTWSDDTSMMLATLDSLCKGSVDYDDIMQRFCDWLCCNKLYTPHGSVFDVGMVCRNAVMNYRSGVDALECGETDEFSNGNGSLMRILPAVLFVLRDGAPAEKGLQVIHNISKLTHAHPISLAGCGIYTFLVEELLKANPDAALVTVLQKGIDRAFFFYENDEENDWASALHQFHRLEELTDFVNLKEEEIRSTGFVVHTLEAALWCLLTTTSFKECVLKAVNLGGDTDTVAAVAGSLAGYVYGQNGIPQEWMSKLSRFEWLESKVGKFETSLAK